MFSAGNIKINKTITLTNEISGNGSHPSMLKIKFKENLMKLFNQVCVENYFNAKMRRIETIFHSIGAGYKLPAFDVTEVDYNNILFMGGRSALLGVKAKLKNLNNAKTKRETKELCAKFNDNANARIRCTYFAYCDIWGAECWITNLTVLIYIPIISTSKARVSFSMLNMPRQEKLQRHWVNA